MAFDTWNFDCWTPRDEGPDEARQTKGGLFELPSSATIPFTTGITAIFAVLIRSGGWTSTDGAIQGIGSVGVKGAADSMFRISTNDAQNPGGRVGINVVCYGDALTPLRYDIALGDEDGVSWMDFDKWYQVAISITEAGIQYAVNGTITPKVVVSTNTPGDLNIGFGTERMWVTSPNAAINQSDPILIQQEWPSMIFGPTAYATQALDLSDPVVLARIYDDNGDFNRCGGDGSYWFGDVYAANTPEFFFSDGSPIHQLGSDAQTWDSRRGGGAGFGDCPGGLRKQYEDPYPADVWLYFDMDEARASGDAWLDGDQIRTAVGNRRIYIAAAAVDGFDGLLHYDPFGSPTFGTIQSVTVRGSEAAGVDPDSWTDYTATGTGVDGVDYAFDTDGGLARMRDLTNAGNTTATSTYVLTSADDEAFRVIDLLEVVDDITSVQSPSVQIRRWVDASNYERTFITSFGASSNWNYERSTPGSIVTTTASALTPKRAYLYIKSGRLAVWFDDAVAVANVGFSDPATVAAAGATMSHTTCGSASNSPFTLKLGFDVFGKMVTG